MSPARSKRTAIPHRRSRAEYAQAAGVAATIVLVTSVLVWLMRPGPAGTLGTGGLMNRQPRTGGLVVGALVLAGLVTWWILRVSRRARGHEKVALPVALGVVLVAAIVMGFTWPGGLLRHGVAPPKPITPKTTPSTLSTSTTSTAGATGATGASGASGATGASGSSGATGVTQTTGTTPLTTTPTTGPTTGISTTSGP